MPSANFIVGNGLSLEGFSHYVEPLLSKQSVFVPDRFGFRGPQTEQILISLQTKDPRIKFSDLLRRTFQTTVKSLEDEQKTKKNIYSSDSGLKAFSYQLNPDSIQLIGTYKGQDTASLVFPSLAVEHGARQAQRELEDLKQNARSLADKLSLD